MSFHLKNNETVPQSACDQYPFPSRMNEGTQRGALHESYATSWVGVLNSLGHWCRHSRFTQAHKCNSGRVSLRPEIVQLLIGSTLWLRHFGQVIFPSISRKVDGRVSLDGKDGTSEIPSSRRWADFPRSAATSVHTVNDSEHARNTPSIA